jgi:hypothetical protein
VKPAGLSRRLPAARGAIAVLAVAFSAAVAAADGSAAPSGSANKPGAAGRTRSAGPLLTPAQLRACLERQQALRSRGEAVTKEQALLADSKAEIDRIAQELEEREAGLDRTNLELVGAYNARAESRNRLIDAYQAAVPVFNDKVDALKVEQAAYAGACENRRYDEADEIMIRKSR